MEQRLLGNTGINVSRLCFGTLTISRLQKNMTAIAGGRLIAVAMENGVNFVDSADLYDTYEHIGSAMKLTGNNAIVIAGKSYASGKAEMLDDIHKALRKIDRDYIDIFLLHEQESLHTLRGHGAAIEALVEAKRTGKIRALGISTHRVAAVRSAALLPEIDVIHPLINRLGIGIQDGTLTDMLQAINLAVVCGKGIYAMKVLAGGHLVQSAKLSMQWALAQSDFAAIAIGMQSENEIAANCRLFSGLPTGELFTRAKQELRRIIVQDWCRGCGACVERCQSGAIKIVQGRAVVRENSCLLCGYCAEVCEDFCIKVY